MDVERATKATSRLQQGVQRANARGEGDTFVTLDAERVRQGGDPFELCG